MAFHQLTLPDYISPEMTGINTLIDTMYMRLSATNTFSINVTKSVFSYYCCVFGYARLLKLSQISGSPLTHNETAFVDFLDGSSFKVPELLSLNLSAFGRTFLASGTKFRFRMAPRAYTRVVGIQGFFGHVDTDTHYLYAAYPCFSVPSN